MLKKENMAQKMIMIRIVVFVLTVEVAVWDGTSDAAAKDQCDWTPVSIPDVDSALRAPQCKKSEYLQAVPDLRGRSLTSFDVLFAPSTTLFRGQSRPIVTIRQVARLNAEWMRSEFESVANEKIPKDSCDAISLGAFNYSVPRNRTLVVDFDVHYQKRMCNEGTCYRGWHCESYVCWPVFEKCMWKTDVPGGSATLAVRTVMTPQLVEMNGDTSFQIHIDPVVGVKEGPSELVKNIVGVLTFGIGSKAIQDIFERQVGDFRASLSPQVRTVAFLKLPEARKQKIEVTFLPEPPYFEKPANELGLAIERIATSQPAIACRVRTIATEAKKFFESCLHPQTQYVVKNGDSLWRIAEKLYGEGQFFHVIVNSNHMTERATSRLHVGQTLTVPPYYKLVADDQVLVTAGDTLWRISKEKLGDPLLYRRLLKENRDTIDDPRKLHTLLPIFIGK